MWLATRVTLQLQAPSLLLDHNGVSTVTTLLEASTFACLTLVWAQNPLRIHVRESF